MKGELPPTDRNIRNSKAYFDTVVRNMDHEQAKKDKEYHDHIIHVPTYDAVTEENLLRYDVHCDDAFIVKVKQHEMEIKNEVLASAMMKLSEDYLLIILKSFFWELSDKKLAEDCGLSYEAMRQKKSRVIKRLRRLIQERLGGDDKWMTQ